VNWNELADVSPEKVGALRARLDRLAVDMKSVQEQFIRGGGKGGQKINKTNNCVLLRYPPMEIVLRVQRDRRRSVNRFLALRELADRIESRISPQTSERLREQARIRRQKDRRRRRSQAPEGSSPETPSPSI